MKNNYVVGNVVSVDGIKINILMNEQSNLEKFHYNGVLYNGISIGSYVGIIRGSNKIIGRVEREFLEDKNNDPSVHEFFKNRFERHLEVSLIGTIYRGKFEFGIKRFPMIFNEVVLLTEEECRNVLQNNVSKSKHNIRIGKSVSNDVNLVLAGEKIFNTHMGIFGNTGSGKSNTLTKLYTELFNLESENKIDFHNKSKFFIIDFNGEYVKPSVLRSSKKCLNLSTRKNSEDKLPLESKVFWDIETLAILYSATERTQRPFLAGAVDYFMDKDESDITTDKIIKGLGSSFYNIFKQNNNKDMLNLLHKALDIIGFDTEDTHDNEDLSYIHWLNCLWHSGSGTYYYKTNGTGEAFYISNVAENEKIKQRNSFEAALNGSDIKKKIDELTVTKKLKIAVLSYFIYCLAYGRSNFEHINPLIQRIEARSSFIEKTICVLDIPKKSDAPNESGETNKKNKSEGLREWDTLNIISFRNCNSEAKKMLPLLIVKQLYDKHKELAGDEGIKSTIHLIIDEAHNILSSQSNREAEGWKDYRLEVFEEIIKEGRKFGFFITLASQRPYDISPTIISQLHNYFIHRLVNDQDLRMLANTVNSLDNVSRNQIPNLAPGQCVITGTSFDIPLLIQVDKLSDEKSPSSENADLEELWKKDDVKDSTKI